MYKIFGAVLILISIAISINSYEKFAAINNGKEIEVTVIDIPVSCKASNSSLKAYFKFRYNGNDYTKMIKGKYCDILKPNMLIKLKTNGEKSVFVYLEENLTMQYITVISLLLIGILFLFKKNKNV